MDREQVLDILEKIDLFYPGRLKMDNPKKIILAWHSVLKDYEFNIIDRNLNEHVKNNKFPPSIADLITTESRRNIASVGDTMNLLETMKRWESGGK